MSQRWSLSEQSLRRVGYTYCGTCALQSQTWDMGWVKILGKDKDRPQPPAVTLSALPMHKSAGPPEDWLAAI